MTHKYLALLRGINVGGRSMIKMTALQSALEGEGFRNVRTYIQSGNVIFESSETDTTRLAGKITSIISRHFDLMVAVVVFAQTEWQQVMKAAPTWWGKDSTRKHNVFVLLKPYSMKEVLAAVGELKHEIEAMEPGEGVLYQSMSLKLFGRTTTGKLASKPIYQRITVRNFNTANKLLLLLND